MQTSIENTQRENGMKWNDDSDSGNKFNEWNKKILIMTHSKDKIYHEKKTKYWKNLSLGCICVGALNFARKVYFSRLIVLRSRLNG